MTILEEAHGCRVIHTVGRNNCGDGFTPTENGDIIDPGYGMVRDSPTGAAGSTADRPL